MTILLTNGEGWANERLSNRLLGLDAGLAVTFPSAAKAKQWLSRLSESQRSTVLTLTDRQDARAGMKAAIDRFGRLDVMVHGFGLIDEMALWDGDPADFGRATLDEMRAVQRWNRAAVGQMARQRQGRIIIPLLGDVLHYAGYPVAPVGNHSKLAVMKSLARETGPFHIAVNALTFGWYTDDLSAEEIKARREALTVVTQRPPMHPLADMLPCVDWLLAAPLLLSGQNIHIGPGMDTPV